MIIDIDALTCLNDIRVFHWLQWLYAPFLLARLYNGFLRQRVCLRAIGIGSYNAESMMERVGDHE